MKKHLHNSLRALFLSLAVLLSLPMLAVEIDGIRYNLNAEAKLATVIEKSSGRYSGEVVIPESVEHEGTAYSVTSIGDYAFRNCSGLTSVTIPNSVKSIGERAFWYCSGLTSVAIPNSVTNIGSYAFYGCSSLPVVDNIRYADSYLVEVTDKSLSSYKIKDGTRFIGSGAFDGCKGLTSVTIPNSVKSIGNYAFSGCSGLTSVTIGNSVESIGYWAFDGCPELLDVYCYAEKVPSTKSNAFNGSYTEYATLHVPAASIGSYKARAPWSSFGKIVALTDEETSISEVKTENSNVKTAVYDLSGRRVQKGQKGIFIRDGKVVVK